MTETSKEYASALFMLSQESKISEEIYSSLKTVSSIFKELPEYLDFLSSPNIPMRERIGAIDEAFSNGVHEYAVSFLKLLCEKGRIREFHECLASYSELYQASHGISTAKVISALPLNKKEKEDLKNKLESFCGHAVIMDCTANKAILGGLIVHIDGKVLDGSVRRRLHDIKEVMHQ